ncbi:MAG: ATP-binding cassette domain-containing protein, partial [Deltaproteobacteria bacterium]|nr:ATP-binding cassette domain-containing protein [Deltaproteobacteria bacterium]
MSSHGARLCAPSLRLDGLCFRYGDAVDVLRDACLHLAPGWTGVVGPNGAGKTTLLRLLAGQLLPADGVIHRSPADLTLALCPQEVILNDRVRAFAS